MIHRLPGSAADAELAIVPENLFLIVYFLYMMNKKVYTAVMYMVFVHNQHSTESRQTVCGSAIPVVPDGDHTSTSEVQPSITKPADMENLSLSEQIRFLSRTYKELEVMLDPNTKSIWCYFRPKGPPSITLGLISEMGILHRAIQALAMSQGPHEEPLVRSYILASQIPGIYNMGGDLAFLADRVRDHDREAVRCYAYRCVDGIYHIATGFDCGIVSISLVQGDALGGGLEAALCCNFIVAERGVKMGVPEILFGLFPGMGACSMLARRIGSAMAERIIFSGRIYSAEEMYDLGVVDLLVERGCGEEAVREYIGDSRKHSARQGIYRARQHANPMTLAELRDITDMWVDTAMRLSDADLRRMSHLQSAQNRRLRREAVLQPRSAALTPLPDGQGRSRASI
jgi:DSF synthase